MTLDLVPYSQAHSTVDDILGVVAAIALLFVVFALLPSRGRGRIRQPIVFLALHVAAVGILRLFPLDGAANRFLSFAAVGFYWCAIGRSLVLLVLDVVLERRNAQVLPKIMRDLTQGTVYAVAVLASLRTTGVEPGSILTTSALLTAVVGLSLQETLGNLFAGLAIQIQRPFDIGDLIQFDADPSLAGRVVEVNWRATKVLTFDHVEVTVPNATMAKAPIRNHTKPTNISRRSVSVSAPYDASPETVQQILLSAAHGAPGVVADPCPSVVTANFGDSGIEYSVRFFTDRFQTREVVDGAVRDRIWYALARSGIEIPYPIRTVHMHQISADAAQRTNGVRAAERERTLLAVDFLRVLPREQLEHLVVKTSARLFAPGEIVVRQADTTAEMYIVERGEVVVTLENDAGEVELARLVSGDFFGEMALMTGEPRSATVKTSKETSLLVINHDAFKPILDAVPELAGHISRVLAERQSDREAVAVQSQRVNEQQVYAKSSELLGAIRSFFSLG